LEHLFHVSPSLLADYSINRLLMDCPHRNAAYRKGLIPMTYEEFPLSDYQALAEFRYQIRRFLYFSEAAARDEGLEPQQHQALLAISALPENGGPTIGILASHLLIQHHSAVGLIDRLATRGLVERLRSTGDRREVRVRLTSSGEETLGRLSAEHRAELRNSGPSLVASLSHLLEGLATLPDGLDSRPDRKESDVSETEDRHS
jgi:DNA-binding MarR family transcriptional regulator